MFDATRPRVRRGGERDRADATAVVMRLSTILRVTLAFLYGVMLGVLWECASMGVLLLATVIEHFCGTFVMAVVFVGSAAFAVSVAARADLAPPLFSILAFRLSAQIAMTIGTGSVRLLSLTK